MRACTLIAFLLFGCGVAPDAELTRVEADTPAAASPPREQAPAGRVAPPDQAPARVRFDLARHLARAELRRGGARLVDLGAPSGHQLTLGGWRTRTGRAASIDGASVTLLESVTGWVILPIESASQCELRMRLRGFGARQATVYLDNETIGGVALPADGAFTIARVTIPAERCTTGEHERRWRVPAVGTAPGIGTAGLAIDWLTLGAGTDEGPPSPESLARGSSLHVPRGLSLGWSFEVPSQSKLRARVSAGAVELALARDGHEVVRLGRFDGGGGAIDVDLGRYAGQIVRLDLSAASDAVVEGPAVVTFEPPEQAARRTLARRPTNVLVYLTDTLRADHLRVYAPETRVETPGLTQWARRAATFISGHSQENWTKPSVATLLSGLMPWEHRATTEDAQVPGSVDLLSERLRARGFFTGAFVANGFVSDRFGFQQGWNGFHNYLREGRPSIARFVASDVLAWLDHRPQDRPFFLYVHTIDPHEPYLPPREELARYDSEPYAGPVDFTRDRAFLEGVKSGRYRPDARDRVRLEALYDGEITYHDRHFAAVMEALERRGLAESTIVVFTADHGEELFDHGSVGHGHSLYEELIRVPLLIRVPGLTDGAPRLPEAAGLVDVVPTILDALGEPIPSDLSGQSLLPMMMGEVSDAPRPAVTGFLEGWRSIVVGRYKLIQRTASRFMLYDLGADPREQHDLASERPLAVRYLRGLLGVSLAGAHRRHEVERTAIDATLRAQLEALGYVGAARAPAEEETTQEETEE